MLPRMTLTAMAAVSLTSAAILVAQPAAPRNLRFGSGVKTTPFKAPPPSGHAHDYFDALVARPEHFLSRSLRDQAQVNALTSDGDASTTFTFAPFNDTYRDKQDALKLTRLNPPPGSAGYGKGSVPQHDILMFNRPQWNFGEETDSILIIWDQYWAPEFVENFGGVSQLKAVGVQNNGHTWWTMMESPGPAANSGDPTVVASLQDNFAQGGGTDAAPPLTEYEPMSHGGAGAPSQYPNQQNAVRVGHGKWFRNICEVRPQRKHSEFGEWNAAYGVTVPPNPRTANGSYHMVSRWVIEEDGDPKRILYRLPMNWAPLGSPGTPGVITGMRFTLDSSKSGFVGPWYGYFRNLVILRNYRLPVVAPENDKFIFQRPLR